MTTARGAEAPRSLRGRSLKARLARAERLRRLTAFGLVAPLLLFVVVSFVLPIGGMLWRSVDDPEIASVMPRTVAALAKWNGTELPADDAFAAVGADLVAAKAAGNPTTAARRLNYDVNGFRTLIMNTTRKAAEVTPENARAALVGIDPRWGERDTWAAVKRASGPLTDFYLLAAIDMHRNADGAIVRADEDHAIYVDVLLRTFRISLTVTLLSLALGFPVAYLMATRPAEVANVLMILVLLPFWTSLLVRTSAWVVLLQNEGLVNSLMIWLGVIDAPVRLIYNSIGVHVAMTHVLLPFMILPLYSSMKTIKPITVRAAISLGASPTVAFLRVYLPQCMPGIAAGALLVFILSIGYYITPALVGGAGDQMLSYFIAFYTTDSVNWGMASALGVVLLGTTLLLYGVYNRLAGDGIRMG